MGQTRILAICTALLIFAVGAGAAIASALGSDRVPASFATPAPTAEPTTTPQPTTAPTATPKPTKAATTTAPPTTAPEPTAAPTEAPTEAPTAAPTEAPTVRFREYTVKKGDLLYTIAERNGATIDEILAINPQIKDPRNLQVGQVIRIPLK
jgi:LysM repeat protein